MDEIATIESIKRNAGIAGQVSFTARVSYPGEEARMVEFVGSEVYGGPVVMVMDGRQMFVTDPGRFGEFGPEWVRRFFA